MPQLAVFPKAYMHALCKDGSMKLSQWIELAATLQVEGLEWYAGFKEMDDESNWLRFRTQVENLGMQIPMMCCSPDFTHPDKEYRKNEIRKEQRWIDMTYALGGSYCRVLSGQGRPELSVEKGIDLAVECIEECLAYAERYSISLVLENHYKDDFWQYPEFAQQEDVFCCLVDRIRSANFGVNYDPSNALLAGSDPLHLLQRVISRVVTMHASDRYLLCGTLEDLRREETNASGYARRLCHGEIGKGLNNYDAIFKKLKQAGFDGWVSIEDGIEGMAQLERSVLFLKQKIAQYWPKTDDSMKG